MHIQLRAGTDPDAGLRMTNMQNPAFRRMLKLPEDGKQGGVWIMNAGTTTAHLMTPGE